jgi:hypothetical protein
MMKSVTFSEVVYAHDAAPWLGRMRPRRRLVSFALLMSAGLGCLVLLFHALDPTAPLAFVVAPVLAGGLLPLFVLMPARFEVTTRFEARHLLRTLEAGLESLGYERAAQAGDAVCYRSRNAGWMRWPSKTVEVTLREHMLCIAGPAITLRAVRKTLGAEAQG